MPSLHIGKKRVQTLAASDGSTIPAGTVSATANQPNVSVAVDPVTNDVTVTGQITTSGTGTLVTYMAPGFQNATQLFTVAPLPTLVVTDGPEQLA
jgi:hypothetical protein